MNPDQAQWQQDGEIAKTQITLECSSDGQIVLSSGEFTYEGDDPGEASAAFKRLVEHGRDKASEQPQS